MSSDFDPAILDIEALDELRELLENELELVVDLFVSNSKEQIVRLSSLLSEGAFQALAEECHSLKGSCRNVGALKMAKWLSHIETLSKHESQNFGQSEKAQSEPQQQAYKPLLMDLLSCLRDLHRQTIEQLERYLSQTGSSTAR